MSEECCSTNIAKPMLPNIPLVLNEGVEGEPQRMGFALMIIMSGSLCRSPSTPSPILPSVGRGG